MTAVRIDILTLFPAHMNEMLHESILGRAAKKGILELNCVQIRDFTTNRQKQVDDYPYGGGWGCVMMAQPLKDCVDSVLETPKSPRTRVIYMSPQGAVFSQDKARELSECYDHLVLVCGHYEGVDERFIEECVDEELSIGDYVLTGGELAAMTVADAVSRLVPGVLSDPACYTGESHWDGLLEYPQYTRPEVWEGRAVPEVLRGGNQAEIDRWRRKKMLERTMDKRPDLLERQKGALSEADALLLAEIEKDRSRMALTEPLAHRPATAADLGDILRIFTGARAFLKRQRVDQWQGDYPNEAVFSADIQRGECHVMTYGGRTAGFFVLSDRPEPAYDALTDGKWRYHALPCCVLHRCAIDGAFGGTGFSDALIAAAEDCARALGAAVMRVDTHRKNKPMQRLLQRHGYAYRGNVAVYAGSGDHDTRRKAFEKALGEAPGGQRT